MPMTDVELILKVQRLRRNFPRNADILELCDAVEQRIAKPPEPDRLKAPKGTFDRKTYQRLYQREYMRKKRARDRLGSG